MGPDAMIFIFSMLNFKPTLSLSSFTFIKRLFTPHPWSGAEPGRTPCPMGGSQEELPHIQGQGRSGAAAEWSYPASKVRGRGREDLPHTWGQGPQPGGATPPPSSGSWAGAEGPRGTIPRSRSEGAAVRRYFSSKVRSSGRTLLEQPWRDTPRPR